VSQVLAGAAVLAWGLGAAAITGAAWFWLRENRSRLGFVAFAGILVAEVAVLREVAVHGNDALLDPGMGGFLTGWVGWTAGIAGLIALVSGMRPGATSLSAAGRSRYAHRAAAIAIGIFGLGFLLRQLALLL
jgi:hypothetical protein